MDSPNDHSKKSDSGAIRWLVIAAIGNDVLTVAAFLQFGLRGQLPGNFALACAVFTGTSLLFVWLSPCKIATAIGWLVGVVAGLALGDILLGLPLNGPIPVQANLLFQRMLGPIVGSSFGASAVISLWYARQFAVRQLEVSQESSP